MLIGDLKDFDIGSQKHNFLRIFLMKITKDKFEIHIIFRVIIQNLDNISFFQHLVHKVKVVCFKSCALSLVNIHEYKGKY